MQAQPPDDEPVTVPAVSVALVRRDRVLLVRRRFAPARGLYAFPGGRVEAGETLEQAARRELFEETGLQAGPLAPVEQILIDSEKGGVAVRFLLQVFSAPHVGGEPVSGDDAEDARFLTLAELNQLPLSGSVGEIAAALLGAVDPADTID
jgi:ADP-ribose pyrophosphatase YjhB (NUDIX family)